MLLVALFAAVAMLGISAASAKAAPLAPQVTEQPSDPNTTHSEVTFSYTEGEGEAEDIAYFQCRIGSPTPPVNWSGCPSPVVDGVTSGAVTYYNQVNAQYTFEVRAATPNPTVYGPATTVTYTNELPPPSLPPQFTKTPPELVTRDARNEFRYIAGEGESILLNGIGFQCRNAPDEPFENCSLNNNGGYNAGGGNGERMFEVRAINQSGSGPSVTYEWTVDIPPPSPRVELEDVAVTEWQGPGLGRPMVNGMASGVVDAGDVDGDGRDDIAMSTSTSGSLDGFFVAFSRANGWGKRAVENLGPDRGYQIVLPPGLSTLTQSNNTQAGVPVNVGDQNGDGTPDLVVRGGTNDDLFGKDTLFMVYGVEDPTALPTCPGSNTRRCLELENLTSEQGYGVEGTPNWNPDFSLPEPPGFRPGAEGVASAGDFDGDGTADWLFTGYDREVYVVSGAVERSGMIPVTDMIDEEGVFVIEGPLGSGFGWGLPRSVGDMNQDRKDDLWIGTNVGPEGAGGYVFNGRAFGSEDFDITEFGSGDGFFIPGLPTTYAGYVAAAPIGDVNRDGRPDLGLGNAFETGSQQATEHQDYKMLSVLYGPQQPTDVRFSFGFDLAPGNGYTVQDGGTEADLAAQTENLGDINNDGIPDQLVSAGRTPVDGIHYSRAGGAYVLFGQDPAPEDQLAVNSDLSPELGVALLGTEIGGRAGSSIATMGDMDGDGMSDFAIGAYGSDSVYMVPASSLLNRINTGKAAGVGNQSAVLNAAVGSNNRDTEVHFEYGTTVEYGETTSTEEFEASNNGDAASIEIEGLEKNTTYHYRAVATNELGLTRYGDAKTFTTTNASDGGGGTVSNCTIDNTLPGCGGYDHCKVHPEDCSGVKTKAKLTLITSPKTVKVMRGKKGAVAAIVVNSGGENAGGVKVCVKAPKKLVKVKKCQTVGNLGSGATKTKTFKVTVKKSAKKGKKVALKFTASGNGIGAKKATVKVKVG